MDSVRFKRSAEDALSKCQRERFGINQRNRKQVEDSNFQNLSYLTAVGIRDLRELSRIKNNMQLIHTETVSQDNNSTIEQEVQTSTNSKKYTEMKSVTINKGFEIFGELALEIGGGIEIPFLTKSNIKANVRVGVKSTSTNTTTNTVTNEITVTIPAQKVKCPPRKRVVMTWNFFTSIDTIKYLIDLEIDSNNSYLGITKPGLRYIGFIIWSTTTCHPLTAINDSDLDKYRLTKIDGRIILKDFPIEVQIKGYHGNFRIHQVDLD